MVRFHRANHFTNSHIAEGVIDNALLYFGMVAVIPAQIS